MPSNKLARTNDDIQFVISKLLREVKDPRVQQGMTRRNSGAGCARHPAICAGSSAIP